jgi:hypothetical protein
MTPKYSEIALGTALFFWALALVAFLFGAPMEWIFHPFMFAWLIASAEWLYSNK